VAVGPKSARRGRRRRHLAIRPFLPRRTPCGSALIP
jgi:hypothetical protein